MAQGAQTANVDGAFGLGRKVRARCPGFGGTCHAFATKESGEGGAGQTGTGPGEQATAVEERLSVWHCGNPCEQFKINYDKK